MYAPPKLDLLIIYANQLDWKVHDKISTDLNSHQLTSFLGLLCTGNILELINVQCGDGGIVSKNGRLHSRSTGFKKRSSKRWLKLILCSI